jgi:hypothetical protein
LNTRVAKVAQDIGNGALASVAPEDFRYFTTWDTEGSQTRR